ncbi:hypothetical protein EGW08_011245, partial [Elysia chlorotica]
SEKFTKYCSLIGAHFIMAPLSFLWNYGNLSAYMDSYFQLYCAPDCVDFDSQWIINTYLACACPGVFLSWFMLKKVGLKTAGVIIMFMANLALIASAWTLQVSIVGTVMLMGVINGMGMGPTVCIGFMYINGWAGKNSGLLIGTATSAPTILSIAQNQIITAYVNPKNLKADTLIGVRAYFSQHEILTRPLEILRTGDFYALWLFGVALGFGLILKNNYYKQFGLLYINNDMFLTLVGSLIPVFASTARIVFGACIDRNILSIQDCLAISLAANSILCAFWFFAPQVDNILYMFLILFMACAHAVVHTIVGTGVAKLFGPDHYYINYGLVYSGSFVSAILSAFVVTPLLQAVGWFWLFASCSFLS